MGSVHLLPHGFTVPVKDGPATTAHLQVLTSGGNRWFRVELDNGTSAAMQLSKQQAEALSDAFLALAQRISD